MTPAISSTRFNADRPRTTSSPSLRSARASRKSGSGTTSGTYRVIYTARLRDAVCVLHAFQKKTQATPKRDLDLARQRWAQVVKETT